MALITLAKGFMLTEWLLDKVGENIIQKSMTSNQKNVINKKFVKCVELTSLELQNKYVSALGGRYSVPAIVTVPVRNCPHCNASSFAAMA